MRARRGISGRKAVEDAYGRDCVAEMPSGRPAEVLETPWGTEVLVLSDPGPAGLERLVSRDGCASIRFWLSPCGDHAIAWTAGDVAHFQLFCGLMDQGWHQGRIDIGRELPVVIVHDPVTEVLVAGEAGARMAGGPYLVRTSLRAFRSDGEAEAAAGSPFRRT
jgi:hypothetical protein